MFRSVKVVQKQRVTGASGRPLVSATCVGFHPLLRQARERLGRGLRAIELTTSPSPLGARSGLTVSERGRISAEVMNQYEAAH